MADLSRRGRRGQILLITAFVLAVIFVGLALVMNTVIYSENLATRADSTTSQPILHANSMETGTEEVIRYINRHNTSQTTDYVELQDDLDEAYATFVDVSGRHSLRDGQVTNGGPITQFRGTWIRQSNSTRNFTDTNANSSWTTITGANGARGLRIFVTNVYVPNGTNAFKIEAQSASTWTLRIGDDILSVDDAQGQIHECTVPTTNFWINVSKGTVDGNDCPGLNFADGLGTIDSIQYDNADQITGTYRVIANDTEGNINDTPPFGTDTSGPFTERGIYGAKVEIDFERESLVFRTDRKAIPGVNDDS